MSGAAFAGVVSAAAVIGAIFVLNNAAPSPPVTMNTPVEPTTVEVAIVHGSADRITISEICHDGVTYLITSHGGIAPKLVQSPFTDARAYMVPCK